MSASFVSRLVRKAATPALLITTPIGVTYYYHNRNPDDSLRSTPFRHLPLFSTIVTHADVQHQHQHQHQQPPLPTKLSGTPQKSIFQTLEAHPAGMVNPKLPTITASQVRTSRSNAAPAPIYVTFRDGVYDISEFCESHPGGDQILLAAGGPLEQYWALYPQHASPFVLDLLEELRVGNLQRDDQWVRDHETKQNLSADSSKKLAYQNDPSRHPALIVQSEAPFTAEPPPHALVGSHRTPNDLFYVRNHMPVPVIDPAQYRLSIVDRTGKQIRSFSLEELKTKFPQITVPATVQCAGNRRNELGRVRKVKGGGWEIGAISNADWTGVRLVDVLAHAHNEASGSKRAPLDIVSDERAVGRHICFEGLDKDPVTGVVYAASVPMDVVRKHFENIILAFEMNGEQLPRDHGFPVRIVIPGVVGARHVKWLGSIVLSDTESDSHWQRKDYRSFAPDVDWGNVDFGSAPSIQEMPVVSAICTHAVDTENQSISMRGYAWSGDGKEIIRVDVSIDGGATWTDAALLSDNGEYNESAALRKRNEVYDWKVWSAELKIPDGMKKEDVQLVCKAVDSAYNTQPDGAANIWNLRGLLNNCWHRVDVMLSKSERKAEK